MARSRIPQLIEDFHNLSAEEQKVFLDLVDPLPEPETAPTRKRKAAKKLSNNTRSPRAASLATTISGTVGKPENTKFCVGEIAGQQCWEERESPVHDAEAGYAGYHEFQPPVAATTASGG